MKTKMISALLCLIPCFGVAQTSILYIENPDKNWSTEAQLNTISNSATSTFGPSLLYKMTERSQIGVRFLAPLAIEDGSAASLAILYRHYFSEAKTRLFGEGSLSYNLYYFEDPRTSINASSLGTNVGVHHQLNEDIGFGGLAGLDWTQTSIEKNIVSDDPNSFYAWARITVFGSLYF